MEQLTTRAWFCWKWWRSASFHLPAVDANEKTRSWGGGRGSAAAAAPATPSSASLSSLSSLLSLLLSSSSLAPASAAPKASESSSPSHSHVNSPASRLTV